MTLTQRCEFLKDTPDGTTTCWIIAEAFNPTMEWDEKGRKWITEVFVGRGCERPDLKKEPHHADA